MYTSVLCSYWKTGEMMSSLAYWLDLIYSKAVATMHKKPHYLTTDFACIHMYIISMSCKISIVTVCIIYCIIRNFRLEKIFVFFAQVRCGRKFFRRIILPSEILSCWNFYTHRFYMWLPSSTSSASWSSISCFTWHSKPLLSRSVA